MSRFLAILAWFALCLAPGAALAHAMPNSVVMLAFGDDAVTAEVTLPWRELKYALPATLAEPPASLTPETRAELSAYVLAHVGATTPDGRAWTARIDRLAVVYSPDHADLQAGLTLVPPTGAAAGELVLKNTAVTHVVMSHVALVFAGDAGTASEPRLAGVMQNPVGALAVSWRRPVGQAFAAAFMLGVRHILEGPDHLLFLLTLLLPAPLVRDGGRWGPAKSVRGAVLTLAATVTAFTVGHSATLILGAVAGLRFPEQPVEIAIAASILIAALAAWRPLLRDGRLAPLVAGGFGLVHGMAFSGVILEQPLTPLARAEAIAGFNLGIEAVQLALVLLVAPVLVVLARTPAYRPLRLAGATAAGAAAIVWILARSGVGFAA